VYIYCAYCNYRVCCTVNVDSVHPSSFQQYLLLTCNPLESTGLIRFVNKFGKGRGALVVGHVMIGSFSEMCFEHRAARQSKILLENGVVGFLDVVVAPNMLLGVTSLLQLSGLGKLRPNTVILEFKHDWPTATILEVLI
jgi:hypothetical protein